MIHLVFEELNATVLEAAIQLDESLAGAVFVIKDDFATGPFETEHGATATENRKNWWRDVLKG